ncbi:beta-1,3-galactosyltransferase 1-like [Lingula anatina]|uniref:Hexosyltransferase n=1 Tax=Lingula anatina TaxID=7574 RepID=A0A1S3H8Q4_LINAN|nr:beta-1,3-galactosyltransferase 1-like [Lingula anatina]|eukprot:XP_013382382.1 beta-1,3-galactosyltransferase 1-like [Lingula anatina]
MSPHERPKLQRDIKPREDFDMETLLQYGNQNLPEGNRACKICTIPKATYNVSPKNSCRDKNYKIVFLINSYHSHTEKRKAIRETWANPALNVTRDFKVVFLIGYHKHREDLNALARRENDIYHDLVIGDFIESYANLSRKTLLGYQWIVENCMNAEFVIKTDDDILIDSRRIYGKLKTEMVATSALFGNCMYSGVPHRNPRSKWYSPYRFYPYQYYGHFCLGSLFILKAADIAKMWHNSRNVSYFHIEDVYTSALLTESVGIERRVARGFNLQGDVAASPTDGKHTMAQLLDTPNDFYEVWQSYLRHF